MSETVNEYDDLLDERQHRWRNRLIGLVVLAALVAAGAYALWAMVLSGGGSSAEGVQTAKVERGSISKTVSTTGVAVAQSTANLSFGQSGVVSALNVTLGQEVKQGDVLAEMESDELQSALTSANVNLASAQAKLDDLLNAPTKADLASADQSLLQAQGNYDQANRALQDLLDGPSESELLSAEQAVTSAQSQLAKAEEARTNLYTASDDAVTAAEQAVSKAEDALANAKRTAANAADSLVLAKVSLLSAAATYCHTEGRLDLDDICGDNVRIPLTDWDVHQLSNSISEEITASGAASEDVQQDAQPTPEPTAEATPEPTAQATAQAETGEDLIKATTSLISANASYKNALASKTSADQAVPSAEADLEAAQSDLEQAKKGPSSADIAAADVAVTSAQLSLDDANDKLAELKQGPTQDELADAQRNLDVATAGLAVAQAKRDDVYAGTAPKDIDLQREQVRLAEFSVEQARKNLEKAQIIAPFDGTVAALNIEAGLTASGGQTAITLNTPNALRLKLTISESDVLDVKADQSGIATFDAIGERAFPFVIDSVGTNPTSTQGVVTYEAWARVLSAPAGAAVTGTTARGQAILSTAAEILGMTEEELRAALQSGQTMAELAEAKGMSAEELQAALMEQATGTTTAEAGAPEATATPAPSATPSVEGNESTAGAATSATPLPGMNASVTIVVAQAQNVLVVPAQAIQTEGPNSVVEVQKDDGTTEKVTVQTGLTDGTNTEITKGLEEGQTIIIPVRAATSAQSTQGAGFQQRIFFGEGGSEQGGGPSFQIGPGGGAP